MTPGITHQFEGVSAMRRTRPGRVLATGVVSAVAAFALSGGAALGASPRWTLVKSPNASSTQYNHLSGASCVSSGFCMTVGYYSNGSSDETLIAKW